MNNAFAFILKNSRSGSRLATLWLDAVWLGHAAIQPGVLRRQHVMGTLAHFRTKLIVWLLRRP